MVERVAALALLVLSTSGCRSNERPADGPAPHARPFGSPTDTVASLRHRLGQEDWTAASAAIAPGSEYAQARGGDPTREAFWRERPPIAGAGELLFPLGPEDAIGEARPIGARVQVELRHARRYDKDPRPRGLILENRDGQWLIVAYRSW